MTPTDNSSSIWYLQRFPVLNQAAQFCYKPDASSPTRRLFNRTASISPSLSLQPPTPFKRYIYTKSPFPSADSP